VNGDSGADVTQILNRIEHGEAQAAGDLLPLVYDELRKLAAARMASERPGQTLDATSLVHEAYLRLVNDPGGAPGQHWQGRRHFFAAAAEAMRRILIDRARAKRAAKRGGGAGHAAPGGRAKGANRLSLDVVTLTVDAVPDEVLDLDDALTRFTQLDPLKAELVKLRFFGGLSMDQAAHTLGIGTSTADRYWAYARAWLYNAMSGSAEGGSADESR
jgi:RNA polymerase sigma factor (TIGR02999 family)